MLFTLLISMTFLFLLMNHPLSLGLILLNQTILVSLISGYMNMQYWFSYILFLILIGGMMILFIYMTSIASNEKFKFSFNILMLPFIISLVSYYLKFNIEFNQNLKFNSIIWSLNKYFNCFLFISINLIIIYLLITLITVVSLTKILNGPLRQMN